MLISVQQAADLKGVSPPAIVYQVARGNINAETFRPKGRRKRVRIIVDDDFKLWQPRKDKRRNA